jgi:hypothetical protein
MVGISPPPRLPSVCPPEYVLGPVPVLPLRTTVIGSPHRLNSEFAFYTHSEQYLNITTHFRTLFHIFAAYFTFSQLIQTSKAYFTTSHLFRTSEAYFGNFAPLKLIFPPLDTFGPPIQTTSTIYDLVSTSPLFIFSCIYVLNVL